MNTSNAIRPLLNHPLTVATAPESRVQARFRPSTPVIRSLRHPATNAVATAALMIVALIGVYVALVVPNGGGNRMPTIPAAAPGGTPAVDGDASLPCDPEDPYFGCVFNSMRHLGSVSVQPADLSDASLDANNVQLQGWAIAPGTTLTGIDAASVASGAVVDYVLSGTYVATFGVPVVVFPGGVTNDQIGYYDAGATVELGRGDAVIYQLGGLNEIHNPLSRQRIELKRAVIYNGDISAFSATTDGITTRIEGEAVLPHSIGSYQYGAGISLWYVQVLPGAEYPPKRWISSTMIGPVDPQRGPEGTEGFVLVIDEGPQG